MSHPNGALSVPAYLSAILAGTQNTFGMLFGDVEVAKPLHASGQSAPHAVAVNVIVGFTGHVSGQIMLGMSRETALAIAGTLMMSTVTEFDAMAHSAIAEVANMTAGACATQLHEGGWISNITIPTVIHGDHVHISWPSLAIHEASLRLPMGEITLAMGLKLETP